MYQANLSRFTEAHERYYSAALREIQNGRKENHWMWFIFPQIKGIGRSPMAQYYAIQSMEEARAFLQVPYLGGHLVEISNALLKLGTNDPKEVFYRPDDRKLRYSMTLFALISEDGSVFHQVLEKYYHGKMDGRTLRILNIGNHDAK